MNRPLQDPPASLPSFLTSSMAEWLGLVVEPRPGVYRMKFAERHIGNPWIRSIHGGAVGSLIEASAELALAEIVGNPVELQSSAIDYLRVTKDADLWARAELVRQGRRLAFVDVWCWQDSEDLPVARGSCTLRIFGAG